MDETLLPLLGILAGVLLLAAVAVFGVVGVMWQRRKTREADQARAAARVPVNLAPRPGAVSRAATTTPPDEAPRRAPARPADSAAGLPGDPDYGEDELPTVVVATPPRVAAVGGVTASSPTPPAAPSRRSAGATIIAFDDDEGEDD